MSTVAVQVVLVTLFALMCGVLAFASMRGRLGATAIALFLVALVVWIAALTAIATGYRESNNFATCNSDCSAAHYLAAVAFLAPPLLIALAAFAMLVSRGSRWRARRARANENHG
jgi:hypothetical protein